MIDFNKLTKEHKDMFPKAGIIGQLLKYIEETKEFKTAPSVIKKTKEASDRLICIVGVMRFSKTIANILLKKLLLDLYYEDIEIRYVHSELIKKWEINKGRKWAFKRCLFGGKYKHIGKDGNE